MFLTEIYETLAEQKPMVAQLQISEALPESRRVAAVLTNQVTMEVTYPEGKKITLMLPEQIDCGTAKAAKTLRTTADKTVHQATQKVQTRALVIERTPPNYGGHRHVEGRAGIKFGARTTWVKGVKVEMAKQ